MAKTPRALKVFQTRIGFFDYVIAVPSQVAALRAWGIHQNVFAAGAASAATDPEAMRVARSQPGVPLKRAIGSSGAFSSEPSRPQLPDEPAPTRQKAAKAKRPSKPDKKPPDRGPLRRAEQKLADIQAEQARAEAAFARRRREFEAEQATSAQRFAERLAEASARVEQEAGAFRKAGGKD